MSKDQFSSCAVSLDELDSGRGRPGAPPIMAIVPPVAFPMHRPDGNCGRLVLAFGLVARPAATATLPPHRDSQAGVTG